MYNVYVSSKVYNIGILYNIIYYIPFLVIVYCIKYKVKEKKTVSSGWDAFRILGRILLMSGWMNLIQW